MNRCFIPLATSLFAFALAACSADATTEAPRATDGDHVVVTRDALTIDFRAEAGRWHAVAEGSGAHHEWTFTATRSRAGDVAPMQKADRCNVIWKTLVTEYGYGMETGDFGPFEDWAQVFLANCEMLVER